MTSNGTALINKYSGRGAYAARYPYGGGAESNAQLTREVRALQAKDKYDHELKYFNPTAGVTTAVLNTGSVVSMSDIPQQFTAGSRTGDQVRIHSVEINSYWTYNSSGSLPQMARMIVFQWFENSAITSGTPTVTNILEFPSSIYTALSPYNTLTWKDYRILSDQVMCLEATKQNVLTYNIVADHFEKRDIQFDPAAVTGYGKIYLLFVSNLAADGPSIFYNWLIKYTDC